MLTKPQPPRIHLPKGWQGCVKSAVLHALIGAVMGMFGSGLIGLLGLVHRGGARQQRVLAPVLCKNQASPNRARLLLITLT